MPIPQPTEDELVQMLKNSSLPSVLVEGDADAFVYRTLEQIIPIEHASFLVCGGRDQLLAIYRRRTELCDVRIAFVADRDMFVFSGVPADLDSVIWTDGYSIENDVYSVELERLLTPVERQLHVDATQAIIAWFAFEVGQYRESRPIHVACTVTRVLTLNGCLISNDFVAFRGYTPPAKEVIDEIAADYRRTLRGKHLFELLVRYLSAPNRAAKYSKISLVEMSLKLWEPTESVQRLLASIAHALAA